MEGFAKLFGFKGFIVDKITYSPENVQIVLHRDRRCKMTCPHCQHRMTANKDIQRTVFDLPFSDDTIRRWDKEILEQQWGNVDLANVTKILIDEKSIDKHHQYITLVLDEQTGELLSMAKGKSSDSLTPFFEKMPINVRRKVVGSVS